MEIEVKSWLYDILLMQSLKLKVSLMTHQENLKNFKRT
jgi:hypothetical protein